jgi:hypothetical protein
MTVLEGILVDVNVVVETDVVDATDAVVRVDAADSVKREDSTGSVEREDATDVVDFREDATEAVDFREDEARRSRRESAGTEKANIGMTHSARSPAAVFK